MSDISSNGLCELTRYLTLNVKDRCLSGNGSYSFELEGFGLKAHSLGTEAHDTSAHLRDIDLHALVEVLGALHHAPVSAVVDVSRSRGRGLGLSLSLLSVGTRTRLIIVLLEGCHVDILLLVALGGLISLVTLDVVDKTLDITKQKFSDPPLRVLGVDLTLLNLVDHELLSDLQLASHHGRQFFEATADLLGNAVLDLTTPVGFDAGLAVDFDISVSGVELFELATFRTLRRHSRSAASIRDIPFSDAQPQCSIFSSCCAVTRVGQPALSHAFSSSFTGHYFVEQHCERRCPGVKARQCKDGDVEPRCNALHVLLVAAGGVR
ncbi:hypothetical protein KCU81_g864, partial [Aureobasidium melanogenum]